MFHLSYSSVMSLIVLPCIGVSIKHHLLLRTQRILILMVSTLQLIGADPVALLNIYLLTGSCVDFLDGWLNLAEKLLNAQSIVDSPHTIVSTSAAASQQVTFDPITFIMKAQQVGL